MGKTAVEAVLQSMKAVGLLCGKKYPSKGFLIGIQEKNWLIMEYTFLEQLANTITRKGKDNANKKKIKGN